MAGQQGRHQRGDGRGDRAVQEEGDQSGAVCGDEGGKEGEGAVDESAGWEHVSLIFYLLMVGVIVCFFGVWDSSCVVT